MVKKFFTEIKGHTWGIITALVTALLISGATYVIKIPIDNAKLSQKINDNQQKIKSNEIRFGNLEPLISSISGEITNMKSDIKTLKENQKDYKDFQAEILHKLEEQEKNWQRLFRDFELKKK